MLGHASIHDPVDRIRASREGLLGQRYKYRRDEQQDEEGDRRIDYRHCHSV